MFGLDGVPVGFVILGGVSLLFILVLQLLIGYRKIRFKGRTHLRVHKWVAWVMLTIAVAHALLALTYLGFIPL